MPPCFCTFCLLPAQVAWLIGVGAAGIRSVAVFVLWARLAGWTKRRLFVEDYAAILALDSGCCRLPRDRMHARKSGK